MTTPLCPYFGTCGGCSTQHLPYSVQLENKKNTLCKTLNIDYLKIFSDKEYFYRNRMDFIFHPKGLGFREKEKWYKIINVNQCVISNPVINTLLKEIQDFFTDSDAFDLKTKQGTYRYAVIRATTIESSLSFVLNEYSTKIKEAQEKIKQFAGFSSANNIVITYVPANTDVSISEQYFVVKGKDRLTETLLGKTFTFPVQGFFQNNSSMAEKMQHYVHQLLSTYQTKDAHLLDLYGGVGTFGICNAPLFRSVKIIESYEPSIKHAKENIQTNNLSNAEAVLLEDKNIGRVSFPQPLFVITDPPRSGMHPKTINYLNQLKPLVIIYISCNIHQLAKEIPKFSNYNIKSTALFDLFPQTNHSEVVVELVLKR